MDKLPILPTQLAQLGFATLPGLISPTRVAQLQALAADLTPAAARNALDLPWCRELAHELSALPDVRQALQAAVGPDVLAVQCTLFDKSAERNWLVAWHQDLSLPLAERHEAAGWSGWSSKHGVVFAQPPTALLARVLALRLHLDDCGPEDGALRVRPGSHLNAWRMQMPGDVGDVSNAGDVSDACAVGAVGNVSGARDMGDVSDAEEATNGSDVNDLSSGVQASQVFSEPRKQAASGEPQALAAVTHEQLCPVPAGGALLMRPLLQHASSKSSSGKPRRVLHFVFAPRDLPAGLRWRWAV